MLMIGLNSEAVEHLLSEVAGHQRERRRKCLEPLLAKERKEAAECREELRAFIGLPASEPNAVQPKAATAKIIARVMRENRKTPEKLVAALIQAGLRATK